MSATYESVHLASRPIGSIVKGETFSTSTFPRPSADDLRDGEVILDIIYLSVDPAMRGWLDDKRSYKPPVQIGEVMHGFGLGIVRCSKSQTFPEGSHALVDSGWTEVAKVNEGRLEKVDPTLSPSLSVWLGALGINGMTAYFGIVEIAKVCKGDIVVISGAAGATGSIAGQIAKIKGATVIGITGTENKCRWLVDELGFDAALNYKADNFRQKLEETTPDFIDVFFDNVGGEILDMALERAKPHARFIMCGAVSQHNNGGAHGLRNYLMITRMRITMQGFVIFDYRERFNEARSHLSRWLAENRIKSGETILKGGIHQAEIGLLGLYAGINTGKLLIEVASPDSGAV